MAACGCFITPKKSGAGIIQRHFRVQNDLAEQLFRADFRTPLIKAGLVTIDDIGQYHTADREDQNTDKNFIRLESGAGDGDHETDTGGGRIQFTNHNADQRAANGKPETGQYKRNRRGEDNRLEDLPFGSSETACRREEIRGRGFDAIAGVDQKREDGAQKNDSDFRQDSDTEPDNNQGQQGNAGRGIHRVHERVADVGEFFIPTDSDAERNGDDDREKISPDELYAANIKVIPDFARCEHLIAGFDDQRGRTHEHGVNQLEGIAAQFPNRQEYKYSDCAKNLTFLIEIELIRGRCFRDSDV